MTFPAGFLHMSVCVVLAACLAACVTETTGSFSSKASAPKAADSYVELAFAYYRKKEFDLALNRLEKALELYPEHVEANAVLGLVYQEQGEPVDAEKQFRKALRLDPSYTRGRTYLAAFLYQQGRPGDALVELRRAADDLKFEGRSQVFANIGLIEAQLDNKAAAIEAYEKSIVLRRTEPASYLALANLYLATGDTLKASKRYHAYWEYVRQGKAVHTAPSLATGIRIARIEGNRDKEASLMLLLKNNFPASAEYKNLAEDR